MFRSAALFYGPRVIGVVLSGSLDDGTAGLEAVHALGGITVVQDPDDALCPDMPTSAIRYAQVQHIARSSELGPLLVELSKLPVTAPSVADKPDWGAKIDIEAELRDMAPTAATPVHQQTIEDRLSELDLHATRDENPPGLPSGFACPECGGALFELDGVGMNRFRCRVGHAFSPESLLAAQNEGFEAALWSALRALEENAALLNRLARRAERDSDVKTASRYDEQARTASRHADTVRSLLLRKPSVGSGTPTHAHRIQESDS